MEINMSYLLFKIVSSKLTKVLDFSVLDIYEKLEHPPNPEMGDVAFPCFSLSRIMKKAPQKIAEDMRAQLLMQFPQAFANITVTGGYLNFHLNKAEVLTQFFNIAKNGTLVSIADLKGKKVTIEHTSVNPNASPHIGRARNAMIGDAVVRLYKFLGCKVDVHYLVNDIGKQIALLIYCTKDRPDISFNELLSLYVAANDKLKQNPDMEGKVFDLLNRMESGDEKVFAEFSRIVDICVKGQMEIFNEFGIFYDKYDYESQYVQTRKTDDILSALKKTGRLFEDNDGRLVLNLDEFNLNPEHPYMPLTRGDKTSLYPLRDICYNIDKANKGSYKNIVVLGEDQRLYGKQINAALNLLGYKGADIINYSFVLLPEGKMSTRAGQVILLEDLMRDTIAYAKAAISEHSNTNNRDELLPKQLAYGAIKYSILKCGNEKNVVFDRENALNFQGDTSVYIQYSFARIQSLLKGECLEICEHDLNLSHPLEWEIVKKLLSFNRVLCSVVDDYNFSSLCTYLFELCQSFSKWYKECPVKNTEDAVKGSRLFLASVTARVIKDGLYILGIEAPNKL